MTIQHSTITGIALVATLSVFGCFEDEGPMNDDAEGTGDESEGEAPSVCWCATTTGATYDPPGGGPEAEPIVDPDNGGGSPKACVGVEPTIDAALVALDLNVDNFVVITSSDTELIPTRTEIFNATIDHCVALADTQGGHQDTTDTCASALIAGTTAIERDPEFGLCDIGMGFEPPGDGWNDFYRLMDVIELKSTGIYAIESYFFDDVINHSYWLAADSTYIALNSNSDFAFFNVQPGDIAYALGIRSGDVPLTLNGYDVTSKFEVWLAWHDLITETEFTLVVNRAGVGTVTFNYEIL